MAELELMDDGYDARDFSSFLLEVRKKSSVLDSILMMNFVSSASQS